MWLAPREACEPSEWLSGHLHEQRDGCSHLGHDLRGDEDRGVHMHLLTALGGRLRRAPDDRRGAPPAEESSNAMASGAWEDDAEGQKPTCMQIFYADPCDAF